MKKKGTIIKEEWIKDYVEKNGPVNILDVKFVDAYIDEFNPKHAIQPFGANKCKELGKMLSTLYNDNILNRSRISIHGLGYDYPNWVYVYEARQ
ncbi:hypothetical protein HUB98_05800 [Paenibacillus barcinonensis]|uniref:Uncharacterized protein n=1 Tax=Paenibacillus barcinonensis TaxID=198119 RepID=A0A2V4VNU6_PAEBA|nr:hypothetical protein [Paenibacillus barcinonensis]PYE51511.1 hypothetical protein DFQ00_102305 [Paenibacillus barcinonensis]QKS55894.1 hypothetical protein HUB98_05800 [Paenibacillus barcinonensis]